MDGVPEDPDDGPMALWVYVAGERVSAAVALTAAPMAPAYAAFVIGYEAPAAGSIGFAAGYLTSGVVIYTSLFALRGRALWLHFAGGGLASGLATAAAWYGLRTVPALGCALLLALWVMAMTGFVRLVHG